MKTVVVQIDDSGTALKAGAVEVRAEFP